MKRFLRYLRSRPLGMASLTALTLLYLMMTFAEFIAPYSPAASFPDKSYHPPNLRLHQGAFKAQEARLVNAINWKYVRIKDRYHPAALLGKGEPYKLWGLIPAERRLFTPPPGSYPLFLMGADHLGRDIFSRIVYGSRISLTIGFIATAISLALAILFGGLSGYFGGLTDWTIMRFSEFFMLIPGLYLILFLRSLLASTMDSGQAYMMITIILSLVGWPGSARTIRGMTHAIKREEFIQNAQLEMIPARVIIPFHIIPQISSLLIVSVALSIPGFIMTETVLSYLGLGIVDPAVSWGSLIKRDISTLSNLRNYPWLLSPVWFLLGVTLSFNFLGDALRDFYDPYHTIFAPRLLSRKQKGKPGAAGSAENPQRGGPGGPRPPGRPLALLKQRRISGKTAAFTGATPCGIPSSTPLNAAQLSGGDVAVQSGEAGLLGSFASGKTPGQDGVCASLKLPNQSRYAALAPPQRGVAEDPRSGATARGETSPLLTITDLCVSFAVLRGRERIAVEAVRGVSFSLRRGEILGVVGESGSGKSVSAAAIPGLLPSNASVSGTIVYEGNELGGLGAAGLREYRGKRIGMIFQEPGRSYDPLQNMGSVFLETFRNSEPGISRKASDERAAALLAETGLERGRERLSNFPHQFSGGQLQRIGIALALAQGCELLIADEPTTALDVTIQRQIIALLGGLRERRRIAIIFISHDIGLVAEIADRIMVMYGGLVMEEGPPELALGAPLHPYTAALLAASPRFGSHYSQERLASIPGRVSDPAHPEPGCPFAPRCAAALPSCAAGIPPLRALEAGRRLRCIH